jgi:hypothetical protein
LLIDDAKADAERRTQEARVAAVGAELQRCRERLAALKESHFADPLDVLGLAALVGSLSDFACEEHAEAIDGLREEALLLHGARPDALGHAKASIVPAEALEQWFLLEHDRVLSAALVLNHAHDCAFGEPLREAAELSPEDPHPQLVDVLRAEVVRTRERVEAALLAGPLPVEPPGGWKSAEERLAALTPALGHLERLVDQEYAEGALRHVDTLLAFDADDARGGRLRAWRALYPELVTTVFEHARDALVARDAVWSEILRPFLDAARAS